MYREEYLAGYEARAAMVVSGDAATVGGNYYRGSGRVSVKMKNKSKFSLSSLGAMGFVVLMLVVFVAFFGMGNLQPAAISQRLLEETDVQYADMVESKKIVFQEALREGKVPADTAEILKKRGFVVGYMQNGEFVEGNEVAEAGELVLKTDEKVIAADEFISEMGVNAELYSALKEATYDRAAGYYDDAALEVFEKELGTNRHNFSGDADFEDVLREKMGKGSDVSIGGVGVEEDEEGNRSYVVTGTAKSSGGAEQLVEAARQGNLAGDSGTSALNAADTLAVADSTVQDRRSSLFMALMMENISMMMAGDGDQSQINETMQYFYTSSESKVVDAETGEVKTVTGTMLESPALYGLLTGKKVEQESVADYANERILKTVRGATGRSGGYSPSGGTVGSADERAVASGRLAEGAAIADAAVLGKVTTTVNSSMVENGTDDITGVAAGELLASGAVNLGRKLAKKSGATPGDDAAVVAYKRLNESVIAMDAKAERLERSPFDVSSKNTFLGSIVYKIAMMGVVNPRQGAAVNTLGGMMEDVVGKFASLFGGAVRGLLPMSLAEDNASYMTSFGDCERAGSVGAAVTVKCEEIATFDPSTLDDPLNDAEFVAAVEANTELNASGERVVVKGSSFDKFMRNNNERKTLIGVMDGGILDAESGEGWAEKIPFVGDIAKQVEMLMGASDEQKAMASGAEYVNAASNAKWDEYKYAQRYVALDRAKAMLEQYTSDKTAYSGMKYFEGQGSVVARTLGSGVENDDMIANR